jgi:hypothetical protein
MSSFIRLLCLGLLTSLSAPALALDDTQPNREQEAARYLAAVPPEEIAAGMAQNMVESLPQEQQKGFVEAVKKNLNLAAVKAASQAGLVKVFTADELKSLADFYGSPLAKSATKKMGAYMSEVMPLVEKEVDAATEKAEKETGVKLEKQAQ